MTKVETFSVIMNTLDELGYDVADASINGKDDPKIIDGKHFLPQHRERIVLVGFRRDLQLSEGFSLRDIDRFYPSQRPTFGQLLEPTVDSKYVLSHKLWDYLYRYAKSMPRRAMVLALGWSIPLARTASPAPCRRAITKMVLKFW